MIPFVAHYDHVLQPEFCKYLIGRFEADPNVHDGKVYSAETGEGIVDKKSKDCSELELIGPEWYFEIRKFRIAMKAVIARYAMQFQVFRRVFVGRHEPIRMKRYVEGQSFDWHADVHAANSGPRCITLFWYFNEVEEGGETEFLDHEEKVEEAIKPMPGRVAIFPSVWTHVHRSAPVLKGVKYAAITYVRMR